MIFKLRAFVYCALGLFLVSCASKRAPEGGPRNTIVAVVESTQPENLQRNVGEREVTFEFSDYVNQSVRSAVSIQPKTRFSVDYYGNEIVVSFSEELLPNTTYAVTLGTNWTDMNGNTPTEATTIIFATGATIDTGVIAGKLFGSGAQGSIVAAYPGADTIGEDFTPTRDFAPYSVPVGGSGLFSVKGLKDGLYRVVAFKDANNNGLLDVNEQFVNAPFDVRITNGVSPELKMLLGKSIQEQQADNDTLTNDMADTIRPDSADMGSALVDSLLSDSVVVSSKSDPGMAEGYFTDSIGSANRYLARFVNTAGSVVASLVLEPNTKWSIDSLDPGTYSVDIVVDSNGDGQYDNGTQSPFSFSELWYPLRTTFIVRPRWTTENVQLELK